MKYSRNNTSMVLGDNTNKCTSKGGLLFEFDNHSENCPSCKFVEAEDSRMKNILKRTVKNTLVPKGLKDRIWEQIREK